MSLFDPTNDSDIKIAFIQWKMVVETNYINYYFINWNLSSDY